MTDDRLSVRTPLPGGGPVIQLDPNREMPVFVANDGKTIGVESLALNPNYSYAKQVLVPVDVVCEWLGFPSLFYLSKVVPDDKLMAPREIGSQKCWTFEYAMHLAYTAPVTESVRIAAVHAAWKYLTIASLQVCRSSLKFVHDNALTELAVLRTRVKEYEHYSLEQGRKSPLPPVFESTFPECSGTGWVEDGDVRVTYLTTGYLYLRFPRETHHRNIAPVRLQCAATRHRENHDKYPSVVPKDTLHPVCFVDGKAEGNTIVVGFRIIATDLMIIRDRDDQHPDRDVFQEVATAFMQLFVTHREGMRKNP